MKAAKKIEAFEVKEGKWQSPIDVSKYNRSPYLTNSEKEELTIVLNKKSTWFKKSYLILDRLLKPLHDCLDYIKSNKTNRVKTVRLFFLEMEKRQTSYWAWSSEEWLEVFNSNLLSKKYSRTTAVLIAYFLIDNFEYLPSKINHHQNLAIKIFGENIVKNNIDILCKEYIRFGYGKGLTKSMIPNTFCFILLTNRSPLVKDITREVLNKCRKNTNSEIVSISFNRQKRW